MEGLSPTPIPTIVTTPIQEEDTYQNEWGKVTGPFCPPDSHFIIVNRVSEVAHRG